MSVIKLIETSIFAAFYPVDPGAIFTIPIDGYTQACIEVHAGLPPGCPGELFIRQRIAAIVTGSISHAGNEALRFPGYLQNAANYFDIRK